MTFEHDAVIATLASRASDQTHAAITALIAGRSLDAQVFLNASQATMHSLLALLDGTQPPVRGLAVVSPDEDAEPDWFDRKANDSPDGAA